MGKKARKRSTQEAETADQASQVITASQSQEPGPTVFELILACLLAYGVCFLLRVVELPAWQAAHLSIQDEFLMATHDAYVWLAGAEGINRKTGTPLSGMLAALHDLTGFNLANIGFWLPAILAPLTVLPIALWAWREKQPEAGLASGIMAAGCLGFLLRTRLGFVDTDILTLFFPVAVAAGLMIWLSLIGRATWRISAGDGEPPDRVGSVVTAAVVIGLLIQGYGAFYGKLHIALALVGLALVIGLFLAPGHRLRMFLFSFVTLLAIGFGGWFGLGLGLVFAAGVLWRPKLPDQWLPLGLATLLTLVICGAEVFNLITGGLDKILGYAKISSSEITRNATLSLPAIAQSVREAQNVNWGAMAARTAGSWWLFWPGVAGFVYLLYRRPLYLIWLPFLALGIASVTLGNRFSMFGGAAIGLGLAFGLNRLLLDLGQARWRRWAVQIALSFVVAWPLWTAASSFRPAPILPRIYAQTFLDLRKAAPEEAQLWQWWDYGYAGQYYAQRRTFGDGAKHDGKYLYPLAKVHSTHWPLQARQMIKMTAATQMEQFDEMVSNGTYTHPGGERPFYPGDPVQRLREMGPQKAQAFIESLKTTEKAWPEGLPPQVFVVSWENLRLAYWISFYGNWDLATGQASPGRIQRVRGKAQFDTQNGMVELADGRMNLDGLDVLGENGGREFSWPNGSGIHAILNQFSQELYLMDSRIYNSVMVQMLIKDPSEHQEHFELVVDRWPWARAYRVK